MQMLYIVILWMGLVGPLSYFAVAVSAFCKKVGKLDLQYGCVVFLAVLTKRC